MESMNKKTKRPLPLGNNNIWAWHSTLSDIKRISTATGQSQIATIDRMAKFFIKKNEL